MLRYLFGGPATTEEMKKEPTVEGSLVTAVDGVGGEQMGGGSGLTLPETEAIKEPVENNATVADATDHVTWTEFDNANEKPVADGSRAGSILEGLLAKEAPTPVTEDEKVAIGEEILKKPDVPGSGSNWDEQHPIKLPDMKDEPTVSEPKFTVETNETSSEMVPVILEDHKAEIVTPVQETDNIVAPAQELYDAQKDVQAKAEALTKLLQIQADDARKWKEKASSDLAEASKRQESVAARMDHAQKALDAANKTLDYYDKLVQEAKAEETRLATVEGTSTQQV